MAYSVRSLKPSDEPFLWEALYQALYVSPGVPPLPREIVQQPELAKYVRDWERDRDCGFVAILKDSDIPIGAVWLRLFNRDNPGYGYIDDLTPELAIAILPEYRGQGIGTMLLAHLFEQVRFQYSAISLSVSAENPALRLYRRLGFEVVKRENHTLTMKKALQEQ
ncbi:GNAT family N-acetyltransferase [Lusitaniella coriacea LEGE 07157]|uniref:GNAT family N-acetyltransferase n=1 Tax=Lusitaniella coriacea LEGE 07157 TaxID=945747 RepID=A0A8J7E0Q6_9CYAN|nr:GNAT family N-acetyltransferase [Lusitaniella coriacea]MBE9118925.1 GNAT family N-acetyltransferase [Lusitaniella coriacea LEGE 07157]